MRRLLALLILLAAPAWAATYYVDCNAANDTDTGLIGHPWKTIAKVNGSSFNPGDSVLFNKTCTWREQLTVPSSGTNGSPITFGAYGTGADPIISGSDVLATWTNEDVLYYKVVATEPQQVFSDGSRLVQVATKGALVTGKWWWDAANTRVYLFDDPAALTIEAGKRDEAIVATGKSYVTVDGLTLRHGQRAGVDITTNDNYWIIQNCLIEYNYLWGIFNQSNSSKNVHNTFQLNEVRYNGGPGIDNGAYTEDTLVAHNIIHHNGCLNDADAEGNNQNYTAGVKSNMATCVRLTVEYNTIYSNGFSAAWSSGAGIWSDGCGAGHIFRYNKIYNNGFHGITLELTSGAEIYGNVVYGTHQGPGGWCGGICIYGRSAEGGPSNNNLIYNNTLYDNDAGIWMRGEVGQDASLVGNIVKNNIVFGSTRAELLAENGGENDGTLGSGNVYWYNCFGPNANNLVEWGSGTFKTTYAQWEAAGGIILDGGTTHSIESDPLFTNAAGGDFTLQAGSPCIDAGVDLTSTYQTALIPAASWVASVLTGSQYNAGQKWECGAYLYPNKRQTLIVVSK